MRRTRRTIAVVFTVAFSVLAAMLGGAAPASATDTGSEVGVAEASADAADAGSGAKNGGRTKAKFDIVGHRCSLEVRSERTRRDGTTVIRTTQTGVTDASIGLMTGVLTVRNTAVISPDGTGWTYGRWTMEPDRSTGSIRGYFKGTISGENETEIKSVGYGRAALSGVTVEMVTTTPGPSDSEACGADSKPDLSFEGSGTAFAPADRDPIGAVVVDSTKGFAATVADLTQAIEGNENLTLIRTVDHRAAAASRDLDLAPTTELFFGNPRIGTPLMQSSQQTGIDLPQKILIWEDLLGTVRVGYNAPGYLQSRHDIDGADQQLQTVANALAGLTGVATGTTVEPVFDAGTVREDRGIVELKSEKSVDEAFAAIVAALEAAPPVNVAFTLEHDANAARVGLELRPTKLVVFGNPSLGTSLMQTDQSIALDLPQKILVYENAAGETIIAYNDPDFVARRHRVRGQSEVLQTLSGALANFANIGL